MRAPQVVMLAVAIASCAPAAREPKPTSWDAMTMEQRKAYMVETVMPEMKALFVAYDPHRYARMTCATCHGHEGFAMPSTELLLEPEATTSKSTPMQVFMHDRVSPSMARLLGRPPKDYGCFGCHAKDL